MELDSKITTYDWDFNSILAVVKKYYKKQDINSNLYLTRFPCFNETRVWKPFLIISITHKRIFRISYQLTKKLGIKKVLGWIFGFNESCFKDINKKYDISIYGEYNAKLFPYEHISSLAELMEISIASKTKKEGSMYKATSAVTQQLLVEKKQYRDIKNTTVGSGISSSKKIALAKSVSEVLERYSAGIIDPPYPTTSLPTIDKIIKLYLGTSTDNYELYKVRSLGSAKQWTIPWNILFYPYHQYGTRYGNSNGMSCHLDYSDAIENWLFETMERDCFVLSWLLKSWIHHIHNDKKIHILIHKFALQQYDIHLFALHFDNPIPVVLAICKEGKKISTSLWVGYNLEEAISKALSECGQFGKKNLNLDILEDEKITHPIDLHIRQYLDENNYKDVKWYFDLPYQTKENLNSLYLPLLNLKQLQSYFASIETNLYIYKGLD